MYKPVIGLEIHAQLKTKSKMFCSCVNNPEVREPNIYVCPICLGHPGALPVINKEAVIKVLQSGKALNCELRDVSRFDRKNYFYPDLPKGYQISQDRRPLCFNGYLEVEGRRIRVNRIHLEEDTGRLVHDEKAGHSLVDFNRSGVPLMELVTEADIRSADEARKFAEELRLIFRYLGVSGANMDQGQMRVEVNISLSHMEGRKGTRVEIKNLNSFRAVYHATEYEIKRQSALLEKGERVVQETRGWNDKKEETFSQRDKEGVHDYRYFPEPDLPPLNLKKEPFNKDKVQLEVELPQKKRKRFHEEYGVEGPKEIEVFISNRDLADYFEGVISDAIGRIKKEEWKDSLREEEKKEIIRISKSYLLSDFLGILEGRSIKESLIDPDQFAEFVLLIYKKEISSKIAKTVLKEMFHEGKSAGEVIKEKDLSQMSDQGEIEKIVLEVIEENKKAADDYREGKEEALKFLVGKVMAKTKGRAAPEEVNKIFKQQLK